MKKRILAVILSIAICSLLVSCWFSPYDEKSTPEATSKTHATASANPTGDVEEKNTASPQGNETPSVTVSPATQSPGDATPTDSYIPIETPVSTNTPVHTISPTATPKQEQEITKPPKPTPTSEITATGTATSVPTPTPTLAPTFTPVPTPTATAKPIEVSVSLVEPQGDVTSVSSLEELALLTDYMLLNHFPSVTASLDFDVQDINALLSQLLQKINSDTSLFSYKELRFLCDSKKSNDSETNTYILTLSATYHFDIASKKSESTGVKELASANAMKIVPTRSASYNGFAIEKSTRSMTVHNSNALFWAIENGVKPVIDPSNTALTELYGNMKKILRNIINDNMSDYKKVRAIYEYLVLNVTYDNDLYEKALSAATSEDQSKYNGYNSAYLEGAINDHLAVCDGISKAFSALCNMEGIQCVRVTGHAVNGVPHAWNKVYVNGNWYICDATYGGASILSRNCEYLSYCFLLVSDNNYSRHAIPDGNNHADLKCNYNYDNYSQQTYGGYKLSLASSEDATAVLDYFLKNAPKDCTFEFYLNYSFENPGSELGKIYQNCQITRAFTYLYSDNVFTIVL